MWVTSTEGVPRMNLWVLSVSGCSLLVSELLTHWSQWQLYCFDFISTPLSAICDFWKQGSDRYPRDCERCEGLSWVQHITVRPTAALYAVFHAKGRKTNFPNFPFPLCFLFPLSFWQTAVWDKMLLALETSLFSLVCSLAPRCHGKAQKWGR